MRISNSNINEEEPLYWSEYREAHLGVFPPCLSRRFPGYGRGRAGTGCGALPDPGHVLEDYLAEGLGITRLTWQLLTWQQMVLLTISSYSRRYQGGFPNQEQHALREISALGLEDRVLIYPGADEVGMVLMRAISTASTGSAPVFCSLLLSTGPLITALYEDRPWQKASKGKSSAAGALS